MVSRSPYQVEIILGTLDIISHTKLYPVTPYTSQILSFGTIMSKRSGDYLEAFLYTTYCPSSQNQLVSQCIYRKEPTVFAIFPTLPQQELVRPVV